MQSVSKCRFWQHPLCTVLYLQVEEKEQKPTLWTMWHQILIFLYSINLEIKLLFYFFLQFSHSLTTLFHAYLNYFHAIFSWEKNIFIYFWLAKKLYIFAKNLCIFAKKYIFNLWKKFDVKCSWKSFHGFVDQFEKTTARIILHLSLHPQINKTIHIITCFDIYPKNIWKLLFPSNKLLPIFSHLNTPKEVK